jgi:hypothetical protein
MRSAPEEHRGDDHDLKQSNRDEHERVNGVTHDDSPDVCGDSTLSKPFDVCEPH